MSEWLRDRILGCIVGGAIGDAVGAPFEGALSTQAGDIWDDSQWRLTDDTQLTLATCEAIASVGVPEPEAIAASFLRWFRSRRLTGLGASTLKALCDLNVGAHWALAGQRGEQAAGNGAAMRIAPLAFCCEPEREEARQLIRDICRITHHNDQAYGGALAVVLAVRAAYSRVRQGGGSVIAEIAALLPDTSVRERLVAYGELPHTVKLAEAAKRYGTSGYVMESVPFAIFAAQRVRDLGFAPMLEAIILAGGDTDSNASLASQIAGAELGLAGLPADLVAGLPEADMVRKIAGEFANAVTGADEKL